MTPSIEELYPKPEIPFGYCHCACGGKTKICPQDSPKDGWIKGQPMKYLQYHHKRKSWIPFPEVRNPDIPYGYCHCKCGGKTSLAKQTFKRLGVKEGEPMPYIVGHSRGDGSIPEYSPKDMGWTTQCWFWNKAKGELGYGRKRNQPAHVYVYEKFKGKVPDGLELDHLCRVHSCVNPDHLEPMTHKGNMWRSKMAKINLQIAEEMRELRSKGMMYTEIGYFYGVSPECARYACIGKTWVRSRVEDGVGKTII